MKLGSRGEEVDILQEVLLSCSYLNSKQPFFNPIVKFAVNKVYRKLGLPETGEVTNLEDFIDKCYSSIVMPLADNRSDLVRYATTSINGSSNDTNRNFRKGRSGMPKDSISCYVINLATGRIIDFELPPQEITDNNSANFEEQAVLGRSAPFKGYSNSGPRTLDFTISLNVDYCRNGIVQTVDSLQALCYPEYDGRVVAPQCMVVIGKFIKMKAVPQSVSVVWKAPYRDGVYMNADVSLSFSEVTDYTISSTQIQSGSVR